MTRLAERRVSIVRLFYAADGLLTGKKSDESGNCKFFILKFSLFHYTKPGSRYEIVKNNAGQTDAAAQLPVRYPR